MDDELRKPIKWDRPCYKCGSHYCDLSCPDRAKNANPAPQREWQGLTAEQVNDVRRRFATNISTPYFRQIAHAIESALRTKNTRER